MAAQDRHLRTWPGTGAAALIVLGLMVAIPLTISMPTVSAVGYVTAIVGAVAVIVWWLFFSRARWVERLGGLALVFAALFAMRPFLHPSIVGGAMGALPFLNITVLAVALAVWASATQRLPGMARALSLVVALALAASLGTLVRTAGLRGGGFEFHWRWTPTAEERLLAQGDDAPVPAAAVPANAAPSEPAAPTAVDAAAAVPIPAAPRPPAEWPGFRGARRDGVVRNLRIATDWSASPPVELWRRPIGPGWSSFAVDGDLIYTQEQRGDDEIVAAYHLSSGKPAWRHRDAARFYESNGGPGPRGTPTLGGGRVYAFGGTGLLNVLDGTTGALVWSRNVAADTRVAVPQWGFSSSPLIIDDLVIVAAEGTVAAYDLTTGASRWTGPAGGFSYSSPHLVTLDGVPQVVMVSGTGAVSFAPATGQILWRVDAGGGAIVQPAMTADGDVLIGSLSTTGGLGIRRVGVAHQADTWTTAERWLSTGLKPYFNDFVVHHGHAYGFDGSILSSIDLADGSRKWKGGRYGGGQLVLIADQDVLLVISDEGELALVSATPDEFKELARFKAIEGKTWNHPVVVRDTLLVRNGEEMAAFRLPTLAR
jgi:outer membrane protein assembly factor BamB